MKAYVKELIAPTDGQTEVKWLLAMMQEELEPTARKNVSYGNC